MKNFVDVIDSVVADVRLAYDPAKKKPYYLYGHPMEIFSILSEKSQSETFKYDKYPLIALFQDFEEEVTTVYTTVKNATIVIMTETDPNYKAVNRYANTFVPTLLPLYNLFIEKLIYSGLVSSVDTQGLFKHTKIDRLYYGEKDKFGNSGNIGNDALDAVVIQNLNLIINKCK